jgi:hypothetical protein
VGRYAIQEEEEGHVEREKERERNGKREVFCVDDLIFNTMSATHL